MLRVAREEDLSAGIEIASGQIICQREMTCLRVIIGIRVSTPQDDVRVARYLLRVARYLSRISSETAGQILTKLCVVTPLALTHCTIGPKFLFRVAR